MIKVSHIIVAFTLIFASCKSKYSVLENGLYADIQTSRGDVIVKLHHQEVPMTVANFVSLAEGNNPKLADSLKGKPFYDGIKFHRVLSNFMIQAGDPTGTGRGGSGYSFEDEFPLNQKGELIYKHDKAGVMSMANSGPATNSSQFFITHKETSWLDGKHTVFGQVQIGQDVVDSVKQNDVINKINIIRVGKKAKVFDAPKVFEEQLVVFEQRKKAEAEKLEKAKEQFKKEMGIDKAQKTASGLQFLQLKKGTSKKVNPSLPTAVHYTLFDALGNKIDSSVGQKQPFSFTLNKDNMIPGWKEGVKMMHEGEKMRLFIPSYLAYGQVGRPPVIQPDADLIFEIEIVKVGK